MANRTVAQKLAVLEARRDALESAYTAAITGGISSFGVEGFSVTRSNPELIQRELHQVEKSIQRLYRGGRGFQIDLSENGLDESEVINTTYTQSGA